MPFSPKNWQDAPSTATPLTAAAIEDIEGRLSDYTDAEVGAVESIAVVVDAPTGVVATDEPAITSAITTAGVGGTVRFRVGTYAFDSDLIPLRDQVWEGSGDQTYDETTGGTRLLYSGGSWALRTPTRNLTVRNMKIELSSGFGCVLLSDPTIHNTFEHVTFKGYDTTTPTGLQFEGEGTGSLFNTFRDCTFHTLKRQMRLSGFANGNLFEQCFTFNCAVGVDTALAAGDTMAGSDNAFIRCEWDGATVNPAISLENGAQRNAFIKCVTDTTTASVEIDAEDSIFVGCRFEQAPTFTSGQVTTKFTACKIVAQAFPGHTRVRRTTNQSINNASATAISFDAERWDDANMWVIGTPTRVTIPAPGWYDVSASVRWASGAGTKRQLKFQLNGTTDIDVEDTPPMASDHYQSISTSYFFAAGDYLELFVYQDAGGALNIVTDANISPEMTVVGR